MKIEDWKPGLSVRKRGYNATNGPTPMPLVGYTTDQKPVIPVNSKNRQNVQTVRAQVRQIRINPVTGAIDERLEEWPLTFLEIQEQAPEEIIKAHVKRYANPAGRVQGQQVRVGGRAVTIE